MELQQTGWASTSIQGFLNQGPRLCRKRTYRTKFTGCLARSHQDHTYLNVASSRPRRVTGGQTKRGNRGAFHWRSCVPGSPHCLNIRNFVPVVFDSWQEVSFVCRIQHSESNVECADLCSAVLMSAAASRGYGAVPSVRYAEPRPGRTCDRRQQGRRSRGRPDLWP